MIKETAAVEEFRDSKARRQMEKAQYLEMKPKERIKYLVDKLEKEIEKLSINSGCDAGRDACIDCSIQEIKNELGKL